MLHIQPDMQVNLRLQPTKPIQLLHLVAQSIPSTDVNIRYLRHVIGALSQHVIRCMEHDKQEATEHETNQYLMEARKRPFQDGEQPTVNINKK